jgi:hypothetical protein
MPLSQGINSAQAQPGVCTSTTRPSSPFIGQVIFETDTSLLRVYRSDGWSIGTVIRPLLVPSQPVAPTPTAGNLQVSLTWSAPSDNFSPITDYRIYQATSVGGTYTLLSDGVSTATSATVTSLTNGTQYFFKISAVNEAGESLLSDASTGVTPVVPFTPSVEYLIVAGGGGGSGGTAGGGGAGGMRTGTLSITGGISYTVTVGGGGNGGNVGTNGGNSVFASITSTGGGRGSTSNPATAASSGGSGGGGAYYPGYGNNGGASGTAGEGNAGGAQIIGDGNSSGGGGGGGAGGGGGSPNGGAGASSSITGVSVTYAGGGGGARYDGGGFASGIGGSGVGGNGSQGAAGAGLAERGGGGGGGWLYSGGVGGGGGSGVVVIAYPSSFPVAVSVTGSPTVDTTTRAGFRVYRWTGSGSITF